jgi:hypothetical protein
MKNFISTNLRFITKDANVVKRTLIVVYYSSKFIFNQTIIFTNWNFEL